MKKKFKLGIIGAGFMAQSILDGILALEVINKRKIIISDIDDSKLENLKNKKINTTKDNKFLAQNSEFVLLAIKPQSFANVAADLKENCKNVITIMAGVTKDKIKSLIGECDIARCMPNTPCSIGAGTIAIDDSDFDDEEAAFVSSIFNTLGEIVVLPEEQMNAVTGISGSGPAYVYLFIKALINAGIHNGLTKDDSKSLAVSTVIGGAEMIINYPEKNIDELISAVCSKGGTTIKAVEYFKNNGLDNLVDGAVKACVKRAEELSSL